jgi:hypothetical protein
MLSPLQGNLSPLGESKTSIIKHFLRDYFHNGPVVSPRTCEDLGYLHFVDPNSYTISSDALNFPASASVGSSGAWEATSGNVQISHTRTSGLSILGSFSNPGGGGQHVPAVWKKTAGSTNATAGDGARWGFVAINDVNLSPLNNTNTAPPIWLQSLNTTYQFACILRSTGYFIMLKGGAFTDWSLAWVGATGSDTPVYAVFTPSLGDPASLYDWHVTQLPTPFNNDYGIITQQFTGNVEWGQSFVHEADSILEMAVTTLPSAGVIEIDFREENDQNKWSIEITSGGVLTLYETVSSVKTSRATGSSGAGHRLCVHLLGSRIVITSNEGLQITYTAATNFNTMTSGVLQSLGTGGVISNLNVWPISQNTAVKSVLNRARL